MGCIDNEQKEDWIDELEEMHDLGSMNIRSSF